MNYYLDIQLALPDAEANFGFIWQKLFQQVHFALVEHGYESERKLKHGDTKVLRNSKIAVSFPEYQNHPYPLGSKLRLFAQTEAELQKLAIDKWLNRLLDYVSIGKIQTVTDETQFVAFKQKRIKGVKRLEYSLNKKAKHIAEKFNVDFDQCLKELKEKYVFEQTKLPFIQLESQTSKQRGDRGLFQIFIEKADQTAATNLMYDCYGLVLN
ncbi:type I-F CRISPR-associated endoribonuclease Cas6/Csy4 [Saccharobesus litoralis]|uniref:Type I-F CRISPR-associated endoribonuclease Cas6/Csy4 n=1 Tax=Saccharobesus litoralis TaxID=2172099 RepID=A0A2S0VSU7_9ALTE|nr:type I-F CRISPR-associated endoribonuclease Cas6/Csy4 [Saccharobesus litoralis]AWB67288.1 type I-F CRISPR-associated endoribonuclease Cas6/Csy4 [Saccharobesus litoralis]